MVRALRPHQWVKNVLTLLPAIAAHSIWRPDVMAASAAIFAVFSLCASAVYIVNDIIDLDSDRRHPRKRRRPFAAGELTVRTGYAMTAVLLLSATLLAAWLLPPVASAIAMTYLAVSTTYSVFLKRRPIIDVFTLTGLYVLRIIAGGAATGTPLSLWLLAFALFFFLSLAFVKRYSEAAASEGWVAGRGYVQHDAVWIQSVGTSAGYMAVLVLALYVNSGDVTGLYTRPRALVLLCPLLLWWLTRLWFRAGRRVVHDDPVIEALTDRATLFAAAAALTIFALAI